MAFEYCCFISYPHGQANVLVPFVDDFVEGLKTEIGAQSRKQLWFDQFLTGGRRLDEAVGAGLCKSACMILLYTPLYFDEEHTYCARELKAMQDLEAQRMKFLRDKSNGLIIPVILRGEKRFPQALRNGLFYDFTQILLCNPSDKIQVRYADQIRKIAEYILDRCESLEAVANQFPHDCDQYCLPSADDARAFVETVLGKKITDVVVPFVVRTEDPASV